MIFENFINGQPQTVGAELELRLLDKQSFCLKNKFAYVNEHIDETYRHNLASEFLASMIEINSPVYHHAHDVVQYFKSCVQAMNTCLEQQNVITATSGAYALKNKDICISNKERYKRLFEEHQVLLNDFHICGLHVHIGFDTFEEALHAFNFSMKFLPFFVALSASSPFFNNQFTGIHSYRTKMFDRLPKASIPQYFDSYEEMKTLFDMLYDNEVIQSEKDIWWDIRIQPNFKTIEFRVCDAVADFDRLEAIIALVKGICKYSKIAEVKKLPMQILKQNMWSATRYSMDAQFININGKLPIKKAMQQLVHKLMTHNVLESQKLVLKYINEDSVAQQMIALYEKEHDLVAVEKVGLFKGLNE